jgi:membrane protein implicated in regulation of membrane protease activity
MKLFGVVFTIEFLWTLAGILLIFVELFVPHFVLAFFGGGALITALATAVGLTPSPASQLAVFIVSSLLLLFLLRRYLKKTMTGNMKDTDDAQAFNLDIGKIVPVVRDIDPHRGHGKVKYLGTHWEAMAEEFIGEGESVRIVGGSNLTLRVERINKEK